MKDAEKVKQQALLYEDIILKQIGTYIGNERNTKRISGKKITVRDLNHMTGVSIGVISDLENKRCMPRIETLIRICEALEIPLSNLFEQMKPVTENQPNGSKLIPDDNMISKYNKLSSLLSNLEYSKKEIADIVAFAEFIDFKKQGR